MSTRRYFPILAPGTAKFPVWFYGNGAGIGAMVVYSDGQILFPSADLKWAVLPNLYSVYGSAGVSFVTTDPAIMPGAATEAQGLALVMSAAGGVNSTLLGTFVSPNDQGFLFNITAVGGIAQFAALPTSCEPITLGSPSPTKHLLCAGAFSYYYLAGSTTAVGQVAAIDMATGAIDPSFTGQAVTINSAYGSTDLPAPKLFSDGAAGFGLYSAGVAKLTVFNYVYGFGVISGAGTLVSAVEGSPTGPPITLPLAQYGSTGINGPVLLTAAGAAGAAFTSARFGLAKPVPDGAGKFWQDSVVLRQAPDPASPGGTGLTVSQFSLTTPSGRVNTTFRVIALCGLFSGGTLTLPVPFIAEGGSACLTVTGTFGTAAALAAAVGTMFPECSFTFVDNSIAGSTLQATITFTPPTGARYYPSGACTYSFYTTGAQFTGGPGFYLALEKSDGSDLAYYLTPQISATSTYPNFQPVSSALATNGSLLCHVYNFLDSPTLNVQWRIMIQGVVVINLSINYPFAVGFTNLENGQFTASPQGGDYLDCPVSVVPFGSGFAIGLPYLPKYGTSGTPGAPLQYAINVAKAGHTTVLTSCPILLIDSAGTINTAFDSAAYANFFGLARTDGVRFGPFALAVNAAGNLIFGSYYTPTYFDLGATVPTPADALGNLTPAPVVSPLAAPAPGLTVNGSFPHQTGPGLEVFCSTDAAGARLLPV